jgi:NAD(P)-dependent dehydrogenase (short-subunit alcohol dehydrogenase family)
MIGTRWHGKTAFITGGVSGLGLGIAQAFAKAGMTLILSYRNEDYRAKAAQWFADHGHATPRFVKLDVTDRARFAEIAAEVGKVHVLVNNAGVSVFGPTDEASYADYDWIMGVNFGGVVNGLVSFIPGMKAHGEGGHIVNVASMAAYCAGPQAGIYTASKFAVRGLTESLRYNLAPYNIGVSLMCPGLTKTNAWDSALKRPADFAGSGFAAPDRAELEQFGTAFELGMEPLEVGEKILAGMTANKGLILSHPDHAEDIEDIYRDTMAALPDEPIPEGRVQIERLRREGNRAAAAGNVIGIGDLT